MLDLRRRLTFAILILGLAASVPGRNARAQVVSVYGTFSPIHVGNAVTGTTTTGGYWAEGIGGGVTLTPFHAGPVSLGLDIRGSKAWQKQSADTILVGVKLGINPPILPIKPYIQASGGYIGSRATLVDGEPFPIAGSSPSTGFWAYEVLGGLDYKFLPHLDLRLIEIGGGQGLYRSGPTNAPNISLLTINTGVVLHF